MTPLRHGPRASKRFGQHFLRSGDVLERIVDAAQICERDSVLEIGAGLGDLTLYLAKKAKEVLALELDKRLLGILEQRVRAASNIRILQQDALRFPLPEGLRQMDRPRKVVANLPYNIGTRILMRLAAYPSEIDLMVLMFQKEVAERITAPAGSKAYGSLSVLLALHWDSRMVLKVPPGAFRPSPKVESALVAFTPLESPRVDVGDQGIFQKLVRAAFAQRRKTLLNALQSLPGADKQQVQGLLRLAEIQFSRRAETLSLEEFARLGRVATGLWERGLQTNAGMLSEAHDQNP